MLAEGRDVYGRSWDTSARPAAGSDETSDLLVRLADIEEATAGGIESLTRPSAGGSPDRPLTRSSAGGGPDRAAHLIIGRRSPTGAAH